MTQLYRVIESHIKAFERGLHTSIPAVVISYDPDECTVDAQISVSEYDIDGAIRIPSKLERVPVLFPTTSESGITFPIKKGDKIVLHFCHSNIENFFTQPKEGFQDVTDPRTIRKHDVDDCFATIGFRGYDDTPVNNKDSLDFYFKGSRITISENGSLEIEVKNQSNSVDTNIDISDNGELSITNNKQGSSLVMKENGDIEAVTKAKFSVDNGTVELVEALSDLIQMLSDTTVNTSYGLSILNTKPQLVALKTKLDSMKK